MKNLEFQEMENLLGGNCTGQNVINCVTAAYSNNGWVSVWAFVQTAFIPQTAVAISLGCAAINGCL